MKIKRSQLVKVMKKVCVLSSDNTIIPIYNQALLTCKNNNLTVSRVNNENEVHVNVVVEEGSDECMTVEAKPFCNLLEKLKSDYIYIEKSENSVKISTDNFKAEYETFREDDFPKFNNSSEKILNINIKTNELLDMLKLVSFSCSTENFNVALKSILFSIKEKYITSVATDGKRMSINQLKGEFNDNKDIILPNVYNTIKSIFSDEDTLNISICDKTIEVSSQDVKYIAILINATYPNYEKVIPNTSEWNILKFDLEDFKNALDIVTIKEGTQKDIILDISENKIELIKIDKDKKIASFIIDSQYNGKNDKIMLNSDYLKQFCKIYDQKDVIVKLYDANRPIVFEHENFKHIIMPLKITK